MRWIKRELPQQFYEFVDSGYGKYTATALCRAGIESIEAAKEYLESEELITRACHDGDKRNINITLTENGRRITEEVNVKQQEAVKQMMLSLTSEELTTLETLMNKLLADWDYKFGEEAKCCLHEKKRGKEE